MTPRLTARVRRFLERDVDSVEALEVLLLLRGDREQSWALDAIVRELRSTPYAIRGRLEGLARRRLVRRENDRWRYAATPAVDAVVEEVRGCYDKLRFRVIEALYGERPDALQAFADAFRLREDEDEDDR